MGRKNRGELIRVMKQHSVSIIIQNIITQTHVPNYLLCVPNVYNPNVAILVTYYFCFVYGQNICFHICLVAIKLKMKQHL